MNFTLCFKENPKYIAKACGKHDEAKDIER
jgi:hypothetical protein